MELRRVAVAVLFFGVAVSGCEREDTRTVTTDPADTLGVAQTPAAGTPGTAGVGTGETVQVQLIDRQGGQVGTAQLSETGQGVQIAVRATNLPPGPRGIHFHETAQCDPPEFQSAGAHYAPQGRQHGLENPQGPHAGDLPNLMVRQDGTADTVLVSNLVTLREGQQNSLLRNGAGVALVIHENQDDQRTDPSGNSGDRIACGVIARR